MRKNGKPNMNTFVKSRDAAGYRSMISKGATRMAAHGSYSTGAAKVMLFVSKLSKMTFEQGMPGLFLDYCEEHCEMHKGQGLASGLNPLDTNVLTETVLAEKNRCGRGSDRSSRSQPTRVSCSTFSVVPNGERRHVLASGARGLVAA